MASEETKAPRTVDLTPTWRGIVPILVEAIRNGTDEGRKMAIEELYVLADFVDAANAAAKPAAKAEG